MNTWFDSSGIVGDMPMDDRGLQYGDGLFETIAIRSGAPRLLNRHMQRLESSCARLSIPFPGIDALEKTIQRSISDAGFDNADATAKLILTAGRGERGYARPAEPEPSVRVGIFPSRPARGVGDETGVDLVICETRLAEQPRLAGMKTLNRLEQVLGRMEVSEAFEGLMCDLADRAICGTMSNVFIVQNNQISTPSLHRCGVEGVTRAEILERASLAGIDIAVRDIPLGDCVAADEVLLSNSQFGLLPVRSIAGRELKERSVLARLRELLVHAGFAE